MGKIYEGENKLNVVQVCKKLGEEITTEQAKALALRCVERKTSKSTFALMVLDGYKDMPSTTEHDAMVKKLAKHLMEKYMKSTATMEGEEDAFKSLIIDIIKKSEE